MRSKKLVRRWRRRDSKIRGLNPDLYRPQDLRAQGVGGDDNPVGKKVILAPGLVRGIFAAFIVLLAFNMFAVIAFVQEDYRTDSLLAAMAIYSQNVEDVKRAVRQASQYAYFMGVQADQLITGVDAVSSDMSKLIELADRSMQPSTIHISACGDSATVHDKDFKDSPTEESSLGNDALEPVLPDYGSFQN